MMSAAPKWNFIGELRDFSIEESLTLTIWHEGLGHEDEIIATFSVSGDQLATLMEEVELQLTSDDHPRASLEIAVAQSGMIETDQERHFLSKQWQEQVIPTDTVRGDKVEDTAAPTTHGGCAHATTPPEGHDGHAGLFAKFESDTRGIDIGKGPPTDTHASAAHGSDPASAAAVPTEPPVRKDKKEKKEKSEKKHKNDHNDEAD